VRSSHTSGAAKKTQSHNVLTEEIWEGDSTWKDASPKNLCASWLFKASVNCLSSDATKLLKLWPDRVTLQNNSFLHAGNQEVGGEICTLD
jgi:hypothetical protein